MKSRERAFMSDTKQYLFNAGIIGAVVGVPVLFGVDKCTDLSLSVSHARALEIADTRVETNRAIQMAYQTAPVDGVGADFPIREGIEDYVNRPLVTILDDNKAERVKVDCEEMRRSCAAQIKGTCIQPAKSPKLRDRLGEIMVDKLHYKERRECVARLEICEEALQDCVGEKVLP